MFDENIIARTDPLRSINRAAPLVNQTVVCYFGPSKVLSMVAISQTLNKLLVRDLSVAIELIRVNNIVSFEGKKDDFFHSEIEASRSISEQQLTFISLRDVVNSLAVERLTLKYSGNEEASPSARDLLYIGCSSSIIIYDTYEQTNLFSINTSSNITILLSQVGGGASITRPDCSSIILGGGVQKLCSLQVVNVKPLMPTNQLDKLLNISLTSERSTSDTISCACSGIFQDFNLMVTGSVEKKIRLYSLDTIDNNIQICRLTLNESARINCLCPISTVTMQADSDDSFARKLASETPLPQVHPEVSSTLSSCPKPRRGQMNYLAYGLGDGFIGVYRFVITSNRNDQKADPKESFVAERLWRHKSRLTPVSAVLFDINGDGLSELVFGYSNGRLEARCPFTGQLLAKTRCFRSDELMSLTLLRAADCNGNASIMMLANGGDHGATQDSETENHHSLMLLACSVSMVCVAYSLKRCKSHMPLRDYLANKIQNFGNLESSVRTILEVEEVDDMGTSLADMSSLVIQDNQNEELNNDVSNMSKSNAFGLEQPLQSHGHSTALETKGDNLVPLQCDMKQNGQLLHQISVLYNEQCRLKRELSQIYFDKIQKFSLNQMESPTSNINVAFRWGYDRKCAALRLSILISELSGFVELFELFDKSGNLIKAGHFILNLNDDKIKSIDEPIDMPAKNPILWQDTSSNLVIIPIHPFDGISETELRLRIYYQHSESQDERLDNLTSSSRHRQTLSESMNSESISSCVYERTIFMPRFSMFVPQSDAHRMKQSDEMLLMSFRLKEDTSHLQILDWVRDNFLCFQFGQLLGDSRRSVWPSFEPRTNSETYMRSLSTSHDDTPILNLLAQSENSDAWSQEAPFDCAKNWSSGRMGENGEMELDLQLMDLRKLQDTSGNLRISYTLNKILTIECDDVDIFVAIIESLVVNRLELSIKDHAILSMKDARPKLDAMSAKLNVIDDKICHLDESERRIQTELYESTNMTTGLMEQLAIATQLNEYTTSKELLSEISMMLDGAQNSARAYQLNNREKLKLSKEANSLKEKMFLLLESN